MKPRRPNPPIEKIFFEVTDLPDTFETTDDRRGGEKRLEQVSNAGDMASIPASASTASSVALPQWPPAVSDAQVTALVGQVTDYALAHGIVYRPTGRAPSSTHAHHAPISLLPSPFPREAFFSALELQPMLNQLYAAVALDDDFLAKVVGANVAKVDEFQRGLWDVYTKVRRNQRQPVSD